MKFVPDNFELEADSDDTFDVPIRDGNSFPPLVDKDAQCETDSAKFTGIFINNFPLDISKKEIYSFLGAKIPGLSKSIEKDEINVVKNARNQCVSLEPLDPSLVLKLKQALHYPDTNEKHFGNSLYCKPIRNLTPVKKSA